MSFNFWQKWLVGVNIYHVAFGLLLAFFGRSQFMYVFLNQYFDPIFLPDNQISAGTMQYKNWVSSVLGAVIFWFVVDSSCSLYYRVPINAAFNLFTFVLFVVPLFFTRKYFYGDETI